MSKNIVSIISTVRNEEAYIEQTVSSVFNSGFDEMSIIDNASIDRTLSILKNSIYHDKIKLFSLNEQANLCSNLGKLANISNCEYVYILGGDDIVCFDGITEAIEKQKDMPETYIFPKIEYFCDETADRLDVYPKTKWIDEINKANTKYDLTKIQLKHAADDVYILGFHRKDLFAEVANNINVKSLEGFGFWIVYASLLREKQNVNVNTTVSVSLLKRVNKVYHGGTLSPGSIHNINNSGKIKRIINKLSCVYGSVRNSIFFYNRFKIGVWALVALLVFPRYDKDGTIAFYGPLFYPCGVIMRIIKNFK